MGRRERTSVDIVSGNLLLSMLRFVWPIMLANLLQIAFHSADTIVIGRFSGQQALAAVGAAGPVTIFFTWGINGLSVGANVIVSRLIGRRDLGRVKDAVASALAIGLFSGLLIMSFGIPMASQLMKWLSVPQDIIAMSVLYLRIYFIVCIPVGIYDFAAAVLRSDGDTARATLYLALGGFLNVFLNLLVVVVFKWGVAGVAIATVISQSMAALLIMHRLLTYPGIVRFEKESAKADADIVREMLKSGIPSALQNQLFSFSNMIIQSTFNTFGSTAIAANTAAMCVEEYCYVFVDAFPQSCVTFTSQAYGAGKYERIRQVFVTTLALCGIGAFVIGMTAYRNGPFFLSFFSTDKAVADTGMYRLHYVTLFLFINGLLDCVVASIRGMGYSALPTFITLVGVCGFRMIYIFFIFPHSPTLSNLYLCFPYSWTLTLTIQTAIWIFLYRRLLSTGQVR